MNFIRRYFNKLPAHQVAKESLAECHVNLLEQEALAAYHTKMAEYYEESINRLAVYVNQSTQSA